jgi:hypothetical protein
MNVKRAFLIFRFYLEVLTRRCDSLRDSCTTSQKHKKIKTLETSKKLFPQCIMLQIADGSVSAPVSAQFDHVQREKIKNRKQ